MKALLYLPIDAAVWLLALMPMKALYALADVLYVAIYHLVGYRRKVVGEQLAQCFPELSDSQRADIERRFYRNFADLIVETCKLRHISDKEMRRRFTFEGIDTVDALLAQGRTIIAYFGHTGNWEWTPSITLWSKLRPGVDAEFCQVYRPLRNRWFDSFMLKLRRRFHSRSFAKQLVFRDLLRLRNQGMPSITGFMSDQKPSHGDPTRVLKFFHRPTAFITGTEVLARKLNAAVVYFDMYKPSRGHYHLKIRLVADNAANIAEPLAITDTYCRLLTNTITRDPAIWLWTHKRWKYGVNADPATPHHLPIDYD